MATGRFIVLAWGGFLGGFTFLFATDFAVLKADWCAGASPSCLRDWIGALSGWAAAAAAGLTISVLLRQAAAAIEAVDVSRAELDLARETSLRQLRAYVVVDKVPSVKLHEGMDNQYFEVGLLNCGQTPAHEVTLHLGTPTAPNNSTPSAPTMEKTLLGDLGPGQRMGVRYQVSPGSLNRNWARLQAKSHNLWLTVEIDYLDAFDQHHHSMHRFVHELDTGKFASVPRGSKFS